MAGALVVVGACRFVTDTLHELDPNYWRAFEHSWLRYVIRAPSDGSIAGWLNAQWFKLLSVPSGISLIYLRERLGSGTAEAREGEFKDWAVRGVWIAVFLVGFTIIEFHKQVRPAEMVTGEDPSLNHLAHILSAFVAWRLSSAFTMESVLDDGASTVDRRP